MWEVDVDVFEGWVEAVWIRMPVLVTEVGPPMEEVGGWDLCVFRCSVCGGLRLGRLTWSCEAEKEHHWEREESKRIRTATVREDHRGL